MESKISRFTPQASEVTDGDETEDRGDVIAAGDGAGLRTGQVVAPLDIRDHHIDETIHHHPLYGSCPAQKH